MDEGFGLQKQMTTLRSDLDTSHYVVPPNAHGNLHIQYVHTLAVTQYHIIAVTGSNNKAVTGSSLCTILK